MNLPYDMGNSGDLLKHGVLAEFVRWQCESRESFRFIDPFGGEPWSEPVPEVVPRVLALPKDCRYGPRSPRSNAAVTTAALWWPGVRRKPANTPAFAYWSRTRTRRGGDAFGRAVCRC